MGFNSGFKGLKPMNLRCSVSLNTTEQDRQCTYDMLVPPPLP